MCRVPTSASGVEPVPARPISRLARVSLETLDHHVPLSRSYVLCLWPLRANRTLRARTLIPAYEPGAPVCFGDREN